MVFIRRLAASAAQPRSYATHGAPAPPTTPAFRHMADQNSAWRAADFGDASGHVTPPQPTE